MAKLKVERNPYMRGMDTLKITGFFPGELGELKSMEHHEAREKLMDMLDNRNGGLGTQLHNGYGVFGIWFDNEAAYMNVGNSGD